MKIKILSSIFLLLVSPSLYAIFDPDPATVPTKPTSDFREPRIRVAKLPVPVSGFSKFGIRCLYAKAGKFDPIIFPGQNNVGHNHTFFGNTGIVPGSTAQSLNQSGGSNCMGGTLARSSFWMPSTIDIRANRFVAPYDVVVYYTVFGGTSKSQVRNYVQPIPHGLKMLPEINKFAYRCYSKTFKGGVSSSTQFPVCNENGGFLSYQMPKWPHCWDGKNLDSKDHRSHMANSRTGDWHKNPNECPSTHPVRIPQLSIFVTYSFKEPGETRHWRLSSDSNSVPPGSTLHGDYMSAINQNVQRVFIQNCLLSGKDCGIGRLGLGFNNLLGPGTNGIPYELYYK